MKIETTFELSGEDLKGFISDYLTGIGYQLKESEHQLEITINTNNNPKSGNKQSWGYLSDGINIVCEIEKL